MRAHVLWPSGCARVYRGDEGCVNVLPCSERPCGRDTACTAALGGAHRSAAGGAIVASESMSENASASIFERDVDACTAAALSTCPLPPLVPGAPSGSVPGRMSEPGRNGRPPSASASARATVSSSASDARRPDRESILRRGSAPIIERTRTPSVLDSMTGYLRSGGKGMGGRGA